MQINTNYLVVVAFEALGDGMKRLACAAANIKEVATRRMKMFNKKQV